MLKNPVFKIQSQVKNLDDMEREQLFFKQMVIRRRGNL